MPGRYIPKAFIRLFYNTVLLSFLAVPTSSDIQMIPNLAKTVIEDSYKCVSHINTTKSEDSDIKILSQCINEYQDICTIKKYIE